MEISEDYCKGFFTGVMCGLIMMVLIWALAFVVT